MNHYAKKKQDTEVSVFIIFLLGRWLQALMDIGGDVEYGWRSTEKSAGEYEEHN